jgi:hypothetical protein
MTPMQFFEGSKTEPQRLERTHELTERRLSDLALAVRQHEDMDRRLNASMTRPHDRQLYRRLRQICGVR